MEIKSNNNSVITLGLSTYLLWHRNKIYETTQLESRQIINAIKLIYKELINCLEMSFKQRSFKHVIVNKLSVGLKSSITLNFTDI
jgi:hypothetical protein